MSKFTAKNGNHYEIEFDGSDAVVLDENGDQVGSMSFREIEVPHGYDTITYLHLCHMDMGSLRRQGLGRATLIVVLEESGMQISASDPNDHVQKDDGSHLIGDGPGFVRRMQEEGLIMGGDTMDSNDDDYTD